MNHLIYKMASRYNKILKKADLSPEESLKNELEPINEKKAQETLWAYMGNPPKNVPPISGTITIRFIYNAPQGTKLENAKISYNISADDAKLTEWAQKAFAAKGNILVNALKAKIKDYSGKANSPWQHDQTVEIPMNVS